MVNSYEGAVHHLPFANRVTGTKSLKVMIYLYIRQTVSNFDRWKEAFDVDLSAREAGGATDKALVLQNVDDANEIYMFLGWCNLVQARLFVESVSWQASMAKTGVVGVPEVCFLEAISLIA